MSHTQQALLTRLTVGGGESHSFDGTVGGPEHTSYAVSFLTPCQLMVTVVVPQEDTAWPWSTEHMKTAHMYH